MLKPRILVVDDEEPIRKTLRMTLEYEGHEVSEASSGQGVRVVCHRRARASRSPVPRYQDAGNGRALRETVGAAGQMVRGHGSTQTAVQATKLRAFDFIEKLETERARLAVRNALER